MASLILRPSLGESDDHTDGRRTPLAPGEQTPHPGGASSGRPVGQPGSSAQPAQGLGLMAAFDVRVVHRELGALAARTPAVHEGDQGRAAEGVRTHGQGDGELHRVGHPPGQRRGGGGRGPADRELVVAGASRNRLAELLLSEVGRTRPGGSCGERCSQRPTASSTDWAWANAPTACWKSSTLRPARGPADASPRACDSAAGGAGGTAASRSDVRPGHRAGPRASRRTRLLPPACGPALTRPSPVPCAAAETCWRGGRTARRLRS